MNYEKRIISLIESDSLRMKALTAVRSLNLPDCLIGAGFVRNKIWDSVFGSDTALNDVDVIYYCKLDCSETRDRALKTKLESLEPDLPWSVKNQARMHIKNNDSPYLNTLDAMSYWPEKQTSIGVYMNSDAQIIIRNCFDMALQFNSCIDRNPNRSVEVFKKRIATKGWLGIWPKLNVNT